MDVASTVLPPVGSCLTASGSGQAFPPLSYTTQQSGGSLDLDAAVLRAID